MTWRDYLEKSARAEERYYQSRDEKYLLIALEYIQRAKDATK